MKIIKLFIFIMTFCLILALPKGTVLANAAAIISEHTTAVKAKALEDAVGRSSWEFTLTNTDSAEESVGMFRLGFAFVKGNVPTGSRVRVRRLDGTDIPSAQLEVNRWSDGSLRKATIVLQDPLPITTGDTRNYELYVAEGEQEASAFDPWGWIAAHPYDFAVNGTNHTGSLSGARPNLSFSLKTAIATTTRREIQADTDRFVRIFAWQKVAGEEHLICSFYVDFWLNANGNAPVAVEWTPVLRLPFGVNDPFGIEQPREKHFYDVVVAYGGTTLDSRAALAQAQHTSWASLRSSDDAHHARKHWIDLGTTPMPRLYLTYSKDSLYTLMHAGYVPPYDLTLAPEAPPSRTYAPLGGNGHRTGGLSAGGGYWARGLITVQDATALLRQDDLSWRQARVAAQAGLAYWFDLADHRQVAGDVRCRRIPGPVKSVTLTPSYAELGDPISCTIDNRATVDLLVLPADSPHGTADWGSCDEAHWPDPSYFMSFVEGERYLFDAVLGSWDFSKRYHPYNELAHDRYPLFYGIWPGVPNTRYGQIGSWSQERFGWGIAVLAHAFALMPEEDPHAPYMLDYIENVRNFFRDSYAYFPQEQKDKGFIVLSIPTNASLWMNNFTSMSFYFLSRVAEPVQESSIFQTMGEVSAKRCIDAWRYASANVSTYRDVVALDDWRNISTSDILPPNEVYRLLNTSVTNNRFIYDQAGGYPQTPITDGDVVYLVRYSTGNTNLGDPPGGWGIRRYVVNSDGTTYQLSRTPGGTPEVFQDNPRLAAGYMLQAANPAAYPDADAQPRSGDNYGNIADATFQMAVFNDHPSIDMALRQKVNLYMDSFPMHDRWIWGYDVQQLGIPLEGVNYAPELTPIDARTVAVGSSISFKITATDMNNDTLSYSVDGLPTGANFDSETQEFIWTTTISQVGTWTITFMVTDGALSDSMEVIISVEDSPSRLEANDITSSQFILTWSPPNTPPAGYRIYCNNVEIGSVGLITRPNYTITSLMPNTESSYKVVAVDWKGETIGESEAITVQSSMGCSVYPTKRNHSANAWTSTVYVFASSDDLSWSVMANSESDWITVSPDQASGRGNGKFEYSISPNTSTALRSGTISLVGGGQTVTYSVYQKPRKDPFSLGFYNRSNNLFSFYNLGGYLADATLSWSNVGTDWIPLVGKWDENGLQNVGFYNPADSMFYLNNDENIQADADITLEFGGQGIVYIPFVGDWDGDGVDTLGLYCPETGAFLLTNTNASTTVETKLYPDYLFNFGPTNSGWKPIVGDWGGEGIDTVGLYDPENGVFYLKRSFVTVHDEMIFTFGPTGEDWIPVAGDWDGDQMDTIGLFNLETGELRLKNDNTGGAPDVVVSIEVGE